MGKQSKSTKAVDKTVDTSFDNEGSALQTSEKVGLVGTQQGGQAARTSQARDLQAMQAGSGSRSSGGTSGYNVQDVPQWLENASKMMVGAAGGDRPVVDPALQQGAIAGAQQFADTPAGQIEGSGVFGDTAGLESFDQYMNPYQDAVTAQQLREVEKQKQINLNQAGSAATRAGAFGDARHGVLEGELYGQAQEQVGDIVGQGRARAYDDAVARRSADIDRMLGIQGQNIAADERALGRGLEGSQAAYQTGLMGKEQHRQDIMSQAQAINAAKADTAGYQGTQNFQEQEAQNWMQNLSESDRTELEEQLQESLGITLEDVFGETFTKEKGKGTQHTVGTETTTSPDNSGMKLLGSILTTGMKMGI